MRGASSGGIRRAIPAMAALVLVPYLFLAAPATAASERVAADYFGVNFQKALNLSEARRDPQFAKIKSSGIDQARVVLPWRMLQPNPPSGGVPTYSFASADALFAAAAKRGVTLQVNLAQAPNWASGVSGFDLLSCQSTAGIHSLAPAAGHATTFAAVAAAVARRYGPGGSFWVQNPGLEAKPVKVYEIWNEEHLRGAWCPAPQPEVWGRYFVESARAIRAVQPNADVVIGGMGLLGPNRNPPAYLAMDVFLNRAISREPAIRHLASALAVHAYPGVEQASQLKVLAKLRETARAGGIPDEMPMLLNEIGWHTRGNDSVTEADRVRAYRTLTRDVSRTNCNVSGILQHAWISDQVGDDRWAWVGIAHPLTSELYPSGAEYVDGIALMRGRTAVEAPTATHMACPGMPRPDTDGDGVVDERDYFPTDPTRSGGGPGGDPGGACDEVDRLKKRLKRLRNRIRAARADERWNRVQRLRSQRLSLRSELRAAKEACATANPG